MTTPPADYTAILAAPFGALGVRIAGGRLGNLEFLPPGTSPIASSLPLVKRLEKELAAYFADPGHAFELPLEAIGTPFRQQVWHALLNIPAGQTRSYGEIARALGSAPRAVGQAVGDNPLPIVIPCHRVIAADGSLGGFMHSRTGYSQDIKRWLLRHERVL
ncbi:MAG: methylated-DNA-protein-cysteine S-methyltransferase [bacterium]|nr:MAG: methylated-DNA-protein-cysteine S-methyltransferase [bacterium]KAF0150006.1 MAG: methylated-DNA-protein-cysteine S-methyltransferase [bacterium]KAF0169114.1 MAG: methylated-DNA-protein-cysteine S-methyltransferase [bacterium]TXT21479.1 MAG: methylated-DNA-protein-cysteine S-methyltransferase [bacterium]